VQRKSADMSEDTQFELSPDEKAAMRAYLQRTEVRLSTMHRVAGAFLSGAGLLFLVPVFLRDAFIRLFTVVSTHIYANQFQFVVLLLMLTITLGLPLWALYLLIRDIVLFYFTAYHAGLKENFFHPRFILSGITFSEDESPRVKKLIIKSQETEAMRRFVVPQDRKDRDYYSNILKSTDNQIIPATRRGFEYSDDEDKRDIEFYYTAFGLTGAIDRPLIGEVAKMEMSLVRHALHLRHLVLRYAKALVMFLLTTILLTITAELISMPFVRDNTILAQNFLALAFLGWAIFMPIVVTRPINWIYRSADPSLERIRGDRQLIFFERVAIASSIVVFIISSFSMDFPGELNQYIYTIIALAACVLFAGYWGFKSFIGGNTARRIEKKQTTTSHLGDTSNFNDLSNPLQPPYEFNSTALIKEINQYFSDSELNELCTQLRVDYDNLSGKGKSDKIRELVGYMERRGRISELVDVLQIERPHVDWNKLKK
jgi:hypothetical protein